MSPKIQKSKDCFVIPFVETKTTINVFLNNGKNYPTKKIRKEKTKVNNNNNNNNNALIIITTTISMGNFEQ